MLEGDATSAQLCRDPSGRFQQPPTPDKLESPERAQRATAFQENAPSCATETWRSFIELAAHGCPRRSKLASTPPPPVVSVADDSLVPESKSSAEVFARQLYLEEQRLVTRLRGHRTSRSRPPTSFCHSTLKAECNGSAISVSPILAATPTAANCAAHR
ncbi:hypothetical protein CGC21_37490 [Leishmania donovani]|uniref:Uncharacterized protein n=1 Tax=Leishmania donovani TaxID=5661 RepID=A0A504Y7Z0_LEIDO|nr:hypothetical protein CGC21_37490 [Leishmania donovani]